MILGGWRSHHQAWTSYRRQRENLVKEIDAIPCASSWMQGCADCCTDKQVGTLKLLQSILRGVALSESYHEMMHRSQLAKRVTRQRPRRAA